LPKQRISIDRIWRVETGVIRNIEDLDPELDPKALDGSKYLTEKQIEVLNAWSGDNVFAAIPERILDRSSEAAVLNQSSTV
jgi:hypothetical protein